MVNIGGGERSGEKAKAYAHSPSAPVTQKSQEDGERHPHREADVSGIQRRGDSVAPMGFTACNLQTWDGAQATKSQALLLSL